MTWKLLCWLAFTVLEHAILAELIFIRNYCHAFFFSHDTVFLALITVIVSVTSLMWKNWSFGMSTRLPSYCQWNVRLDSKVTGHTALLSLSSNCSFSTTYENVFDLFKRGVGLCTWRRKDLTFCFFLYGNLIFKGYLIFVFVFGLVFEYFLYHTLWCYGWVK